MSKFDINFIITKFPCQASTDSGEEITVMDALLEIESGKYAAEIERLRAGEEQVKRLELPAYSFHARFDGARLKSNVSELSGLVIIDIDDIDGDLEEIRAEIASNCESCLAIIISPSGTGLKCLYLVPEENICAENYRQFGREISKKFGKYGKTDTLSLTDCLIASYDENIYINYGVVEDIFIEIKDVKKVHEKLPKLDKSKVLFDDPQEFYELVLLDEILERSDNNFHFIQMSVFELAKFGFYGDIDYDFVLEHCPKQDAKSAPHKLQEAIEAAADIQQTAWPYDYRELPSREIGKTREYNDDGIPKEIENVSEFDYADIGVVDYSNMFEKFMDVLDAGDEVGARISLPNFAKVFRWDYGVTVITGIPSHGKAQPLYSKIMTPDGFKLMGEIKLGDKVLTVGGQTIINGVFPQGKKDIYEITFSDGSKARSCDEHLWVVKDLNDRRGHSGFKTKMLSEIIPTYRKRKTRNEYNIPVEIAHFDEQELLVDPYLLGMLIGDGSMSGKSIKFHNGDMKIINSVSEIVKNYGCHTTIRETKSKCYEVLISKDKGLRNDLITKINTLGLNVNVYSKFIPDQYKINSTKNRMLVLSGLLDTDGYISKGGDIVYSTSSERLKEDIVELVQSLGGIARVSSKMPTYSYKGEKITSTHRSYNINIVLPTIFGNPFINNDFRRERFTPKKKHKEPVRFITDVKYIGNEEAQCISVADKSRLYFTDSFAVTHNTEWVDQNIVDLARLHGWKTGVAGFEQSEEEHIMKMVRKVLGFDVRRPNAEIGELEDAYQFVVDNIKHVDSEKTGGDIDKILEVFENMIFVYGMRNFVIDPFNLLSVKSKSAGHEKLEEIIRKMVIFCKKHRVSIMLVAHPTKMRKDEKTGLFDVPDLYSVKGTSAFYEMAYHGMVVYRFEGDGGNKVMVRILKVKQNNLGERNGEAFFFYEKGSGRYIPINEYETEIKSDCREKNWHKHLDK